MAAYERQRRLPSSPLPSTVVQVGGTRIGHIKPRGGAEAVAEGCGVPFEEYLLHIQATRPQPHTHPSPSPFALFRKLVSGIQERTFCYLNLLKHAKLILQVLCRRVAAAAAAFIFFPCTFSLLLFFSFHILLFGSKLHVH